MPQLRAFGLIGRVLAAPRRLVAELAVVVLIPVLVTVARVKELGDEVHG
jgi:hypothetical protein